MSSEHLPTDPTPYTAEHGERLAVWLEELGLADQLGAAGLPTMVRDCHGRAVWRDPGTGELLTADQLDQLDTLLHDQGDDPRHGVPIELVRLAHTAKVRARLSAGAWFTYESLGRLRATSEATTRFAVHKASGAGELLVVPRDDADSIIPAFQLDAAGEIRPELVPVLKALASPFADAWAVWSWLTHPAALLGGAIPSELVTDPDEADLVRHAAERLASRR